MYEHENLLIEYLLETESPVYVAMITRWMTKKGVRINEAGILNELNDISVIDIIYGKLGKLYSLKNAIKRELKNTHEKFDGGDFGYLLAQHNKDKETPAPIHIEATGSQVIYQSTVSDSEISNNAAIKKQKNAIIKKILKWFFIIVGGIAAIIGIIDFILKHQNKG